MPIIEVGVSTDKVGSECIDHYEIEDNEWDAMSEDERNAVLDDYCEGQMQFVDVWARVVD